MSSYLAGLGTVDITVPALEAVAVYSKGSYQVLQVTNFPNQPSQTNLLNDVTANSLMVTTAVLTSGGTIRIQASGGLPVRYEVGVTPIVKSDRVLGSFQLSPVALDASGAITALGILGGIVTSAAAAVTADLPTGTVLAAAADWEIGEAVTWSVIKVGANAFTVTAAANHTIVGVGTVSTATSALFRTVQSSAGVFITYRLAG